MFGVICTKFNYSGVVKKKMVKKIVKRDQSLGVISLCFSKRTETRGIYDADLIDWIVNTSNEFNISKVQFVKNILVEAMKRNEHCAKPRID